MKNVINIDREAQRNKKKKKESFKKYIKDGLLSKFGNIPEHMNEQVEKKIAEVTEEHFSGRGNG